MMPVPAPSSVNSKNRPLFTDSTEIDATTSSTLSTRSAMEGSCPDSGEPVVPRNALTIGGAWSTAGGAGVGVSGTSVGAGVGVCVGAGAGEPHARRNTATTLRAS